MISIRSGVSDSSWPSGLASSPSTPSARHNAQKPAARWMVRMAAQLTRPTARLDFQRLAGIRHRQPPLPGNQSPARGYRGPLCQPFGHRLGQRLAHGGISGQRRRGFGGTRHELARPELLHSACHSTHVARGIDITSEPKASGQYRTPMDHIRLARPAFAQCLRKKYRQAQCSADFRAWHVSCPCNFIQVT